MNHRFLYWKCPLAIFVIICLNACQVAPSFNWDNDDWETPFEKDEEKNYTASYEQIVDYYDRLSAHPDVKIQSYGKSDIGKPMRIVVLSKGGDFDAKSLKEKGKNILLVNNAIHAGEPCGVDASMMLARDLLQADSMNQLLDHTTIVIIPMYNIGGVLNRNSTTRANQNGPKWYGFRGNAQNCDLNRDFIKCDTKNAKAFAKIYHDWNPDVFIDNHSSNGADYQHVLTLIPSHPNKLESSLAKFQNEHILPALYKALEEKNYPMSPYVYAPETPDKGIVGFMDLPRYSSGYTALFNTLGFITETHMLKPYEQRVLSTYAFMHSTLQLLEKEGANLRQARKKADENVMMQDSFALDWSLDKSVVDSFLFSGYENKSKVSKISGLTRLYYDQSAPYTKNIPYWNTYQTKQKVSRPSAYIIPQAYAKIAERLALNKVEMTELETDQKIKVEAYRILDYKSRSRPYEGHYLHHSVEVQKDTVEIQFYAGDFLVKTNQKQNRLIVEGLEPQGADSYFAWNFFDAVLQRKEGFSDYLFEDLAPEILAKNPALKAEFEAAKATDEKLKDNAYAQLKFIYERSPHSEPTVNRYPVYRMIGE